MYWFCVISIGSLTLGWTGWSHMIRLIGQDKSVPPHWCLVVVAPSQHAFTCYSATHKTFFCIDLVFAGWFSSQFYYWMLMQKSCRKCCPTAWMWLCRPSYIQTNLGSCRAGGPISIFACCSHMAVASVEPTPIYLWAVLCKFSFSFQFISWLCILYSAPMAKMRANNFMSTPFHLCRNEAELLSFPGPVCFDLEAFGCETLCCRLGEGNYRGWDWEQIVPMCWWYLYLCRLCLQIIDKFGPFRGVRINW